MSTQNPYSQYLENQVMTATPGKLLIMTYDGAIRFARVAIEKMKVRALEEQSLNIRKVQNILIELMSSLNWEVDHELAANLDALYTYMFDRLTQANIHDDIPMVEEIITMLTELRGAWADAELTVRRSTAESRQEVVAA